MYTHTFDYSQPRLPEVFEHVVVEFKQTHCMITTKLKSYHSGQNKTENVQMLFNLHTLMESEAVIIYRSCNFKVSCFEVKR